MAPQEDRWWYEGFAASWDDLNPAAKLKLVLSAPEAYPHTPHLMESLQAYLRKWLACAEPPLRATGCGLCWVQRWAPLRYASTTALLAALYVTRFPDDPIAAALESWALGQLH